MTNFLSDLLSKSTTRWTGWTLFHHQKLTELLADTFCCDFHAVDSHSSNVTESSLPSTWMFFGGIYNLKSQISASTFECTWGRFISQQVSVCCPLTLSFEWTWGRVISQKVSVCCPSTLILLLHCTVFASVCIVIVQQVNKKVHNKLLNGVFLNQQSNFLPRI